MESYFIPAAEAQQPRESSTGTFVVKEVEEPEWPKAEWTTTLVHNHEGDPVGGIERTHHQCHFICNETQVTQVSVRAVSEVVPSSVSWSFTVSSGNT